MEAPPVGAAETSGAISTSPLTRNFFCRPSKQCFCFFRFNLIKQNHIDYISMVVFDCVSVVSLW